VAELADALDSKAAVLLGKLCNVAVSLPVFEKPRPLHRILLDCEVIAERVNVAPLSLTNPARFTNAGLPSKQP